MLKQNGPEIWFHEENKVIKGLEFYYKDKESPLPYVYSITPRMIVSHGFNSIKCDPNTYYLTLNSLCLDI